MIREDLVAERIAIESYNEIIRYLGDKDVTSRRVMEQILAKEEEHAEDLKTLIQTLSQAEEQMGGNDKGKDKGKDKDLRRAS
jgi:bacterioferritin